MADVAACPDPESAVIVLVPEADRALAGVRGDLGRAGAAGVPSHVTVIYPFVAPAQITDATLRRLGAAIATVPAFEVSFGSVGWFGSEVMFVEPDPASPFRRLTQAVWEAFPSYPPYRGAHPDPVPHLTIGSGAPPEALRAAVPSVEAALPLACSVRHAVLVEGPSDAQWQVRGTFALG